MGRIKNKNQHIHKMIFVSVVFNILGVNANLEDKNVNEYTQVEQVTPVTYTGDVDYVIDGARGRGGNRIGNKTEGGKNPTEDGEINRNKTNTDDISSINDEVTRGGGSNLVNGDRNYEMLTNMLNFYNDNWSQETNYLTNYGCHCKNNLDRLSPGHGLHVDAIDSACSVWKRCLRCATMLYGEECIAQNNKYRAELVTGQYYCEQNIGSCRRSICECDLQFAQDVGKHSNDWTAKHWATKTVEYEGFNTEQCVLPVGGSFEPACCENPISGLTTFYNTYQKCCDNQGLVQNVGECQAGYRRK